jgi:hypothetical protein
MHGECIFFLFTTWYVLLKKPKDAGWKALQFTKEQFILHYACFVFKKSEILSDQFSMLRKFCTDEEFFFSYFTFLLPNTFSYKKNRVYHRMQREKLDNLKWTVYLNSALFVFKKYKILCEQFARRQIWSLGTLSILNTKM